MRLRGAQLGLFPCAMAWEHVDGPHWRNADPLDHPLGHSQQQGDEPQKHQLCTAQGQGAKVPAVNTLSYPESQRKEKEDEDFAARLVGSSHTWKKFLLFPLNQTSFLQDAFLQ